MMVVKMYLLSNIAILGIHVSFRGRSIHGSYGNGMERICALEMGIPVSIRRIHAPYRVAG